jgi:acetylornithine/N-succinyldiaminopimelate aminotransferase
MMNPSTTEPPALPDTTTHSAQTQAILDRHDRYLSPNYGRYPIALVRGRGAKLWDADGREYLDLFSGFGATLLGHAHPDLVAAVTLQAQNLWHVGNLFHTEAQTLAAEAIARHGFGGRSFFCHSGADANEAAIKLTRLYGKAHRGDSKSPMGRFKIISTARSFHGRSFGTMAATGQPKVREGFEPMLPGYTHVAYNDAAAIEAAIDDETVAILAEPIQGEGGIHVPDADYFPTLRRLCDERDLLLICDEVWTGCGRTGRYFGHQHFGITPDMMTLGKGVGGGMAVGVLCLHERLAELYDSRKQGAVKHATTLGGNPLAMAVTAAIFRVLERDGLVERAATLGEKVIARFQALAAACPAVREVRGKGLFLGIDLDPHQGWFDSATDVVNRCLQQGVIVNGTQNTVLRLAPSLVVEEDELDAGLDVLEQAIRG